MSAYHAPPVAYRLGRSSWVARLLFALWLLGAVVTAAWWRAAAASEIGPWLGLAALVVAAAGAGLGWRRQPQGQLSWDGRGWVWQSAAYSSGVDVVHLEVVLDLQRLLLIRMRNRADAAWLVWADAATDPRHWLDLRRALRAHAGIAGAPLPTAGRDAQP